MSLKRVKKRILEYKELKKRTKREKGRGKKRYRGMEGNMEEEKGKKKERGEGSTVKYNSHMDS